MVNMRRLKRLYLMYQRWNKKMNVKYFLDVIGTIIKQNADRNIGKQQRENNKGRICYLNTDGG